MVLKITDSNKWIFIVYTPGGFGSFLGLVLEQSIMFDKTWIDGDKNFDKTGAAHIKISEWIRNFHHGDDLLMWKNLSKDKKIEYIENCLLPNFFYNPDKFKVIRFTVPNAIPQIKEVFPNSKIIYIKYTKNNTGENIVRHNFVKKSLATNFFFNRLNPKIKKLLERAEFNIVEKYLKKITQERMDFTYYDADESDIKILPLENMLNWESFNKEYLNICKFLNIEPCDIQKLYKEFVEVNVF